MSYYGKQSTVISITLVDDFYSYDADYALLDEETLSILQNDTIL